MRLPTFTRIFLSRTRVVYNVERYLPKCLEGLLSQNFKDFEVILVDDGSTDSSGTICDEYALRDARFHVVHRENEGLASVRKEGVALARGEYFIQIDSDDWLESEMLRLLYVHAETTHADVVICDYYESTDNENRYVVQKPRSLDSGDILMQYIDGSLHGAWWNKLIRMSCWKSLSIRYLDGDLCEDNYVSIQMAMARIRYSYLNEAFYHYVKRSSGNITGAGNPKAGLNAYKACRAFRGLLEKTDYWPLFVQHNMTWMSYLTFYYDSVSIMDFQAQYQDLSKLKVGHPLVLLALRHYQLSRLIMVSRQVLARVFNK